MNGESKVQKEQTQLETALSMLQDRNIGLRNIVKSFDNLSNKLNGNSILNTECANECNPVEEANHIMYQMEVELRIQDYLIQDLHSILNSLEKTI